MEKLIFNNYIIIIINIINYFFLIIFLFNFPYGKLKPDIFSLTHWKMLNKVSSYPSSHQAFFWLHWNFLASFLICKHWEGVLKPLISQGMIADELLVSFSLADFLKISPSPSGGCGLQIENHGNTPSEVAYCFVLHFSKSHPSEALDCQHCSRSK